MSKTAIIADTLACLPMEMVEQYGIEIVAPNIYFDGSVYRDGVDISPSEAYQLLEKAPHHFSTSAPPPTVYVEAFHKLGPLVESILCITISSKLSTFYNVALVAKEQVKEELPDTNIEILDTETVTGAEGFIVIAAAQAVAEGKSLTEVVRAAQRIKEKVNVIFTLETIRHVYRTGRIPKVAAQLGGLLSVKPMLAVRGGQVRLNGMTRSKAKGVNKLLEVMRQQAGSKPVHVAIHHTDVLEEAEGLKQRVLAEFNCVELWLTEFSPLMSYATGRGALGLAFYAED